MRVFAATPIAELVLATASHVITALVLLDPEFALGALFIFGAFDELIELLVFIRKVAVDPVLRAGHPLVPVAATL